jgi:hypothetical protein
MSSMKIEEVKSNELLNRIATHTHIKGLGVREDGTVIDIAAGLVGQQAAREVSTKPDNHNEHADAMQRTGGSYACTVESALMCQPLVLTFPFTPCPRSSTGRRDRGRPDQDEEDGR